MIGNNVKQKVKRSGGQTLVKPKIRNCFALKTYSVHCLLSLKQLALIRLSLTVSHESNNSDTVEHEQRRQCNANSGEEDLVHDCNDFSRRSRVDFAFGSRAINTDHWHDYRQEQG